jgi:hypothetical protein
MTNDTRTPSVIYLQEPLGKYGVAWWFRDKINDSDLIYKLVDADDKTAFGELRITNDKTLTRLREAQEKINEQAAEIARLRCLVGVWIGQDDRFKPMLGGNPNAVDIFLAECTKAMEKTQ